MCSGQLEEYVSTLADKLKKWISIVSLPSRPRRYVKLVPNAKTHVAVLLSTLSKCREEFDAVSVWCTGNWIFLMSLDSV